MNYSEPYYSLAEIKELINKKQYRITGTATDKANFDFGIRKQKDILDIVLELINEDFYKSMPSKDIPGLYQDVYHKLIEDKGLAYIKLQINERNKAVVIQFKAK